MKAGEIQLVRCGQTEAVHKELGDLGYSLFTTFTTHLSREGAQKLLAPELHLQKLFDDAKKFSLLSNEYENEALIERVLAAIPPLLSEQQQAPSVRSIFRCIVRASGITLTISPYTPPWESNKKITTISFVGERIYPEVKSTSAITSVLARKAASKAHADEAVLVTREGKIREGAWSNIFWFDAQGVLCTTNTHIYPGIIRSILCKALPVEHREISLSSFIEEAHSPFITQATTLITPIGSLDGHGFLTDEAKILQVQAVLSQLIN